VKILVQTNKIDNLNFKVVGNNVVMIYINKNKNNNVSMFSEKYKNIKVSNCYKFTSKELNQKPILNLNNIKYQRNFTPSNNFKK